MLLHKHFCSLFVFLLCLITGTNAVALDIVRDGQATSAIIIPDKAWGVITYAAHELQYHIAQATGAKVPIFGESRKPTNITNLIYIGNCRETRDKIDPSKQLPPNAFTIKLVGQELFLFGHDSPGNPLGMLHGNYTLCGSLFAVYDFLEKELNVRWLWPGKLGEVIPKTSIISVSSMDYTWIPQLLHTRLRDYGRQGSYGPGWASKQAARSYFHDQSVWMRRHRFRRGISLEYGHAFINYWKRFSKTHPEYFNLLPNGKRESDPLYWGGTGNLISMSVAEPGLWKQIVSDWEKNRTEVRPWINCCENDTAGKCICEKCLAWDKHNPDETVSVEKAKQAFLNGDKDWFKYLGSLSDRYAKFYLSVQKEARKIDPNATVIAYAYANRKKPPVETKLNDHIVIGVVPGLMYPWTKEKREAFRKQWSGWAATGVKLYLRPNYFWCGHDMPIFFADKFGEDFKYAFKRGMIATDFDSLVGHWAIQGPNLYMLGQIQTHPERSVKEILNEYYSGFGKAQKYVRAYFEHWKRISNAVTDDIITDAVKQKTPEGGGFSKFHRIASIIFTPSVMAKGSALLDKAKEAAKGDSISEKRVKFLEEGLKNAELTLAAQAGYERYRKVGDIDSYRNAVRKLDAFRAKTEKDNIANMGILAQFEAYTWNRGTLDLLAQPPLAGNWKFMWDPEKIGISKGWNSETFDDSKWMDISTDGPWEKQPVGKMWKKEHGKDYDGIAWYRIRFSVKPAGKHKRYRLVFGAVDEACTIWVNGKLVHKRPFPYQGSKDSWKQAFDFDITKAIRTDSPNMLAVRVEDNAGAGGIWKPVWLVESDKPVSEADNTIPNGGFEKGKTNWSVNTMCGKFKFDIDKGQSHRGKASAKITCLKVAAVVKRGFTSSWGRWYQTGIPVKQGKEYHLRIWVKTSAKFAGEIRLWFRSGKGRPEANQSINLLTTDGLWKEVVFKKIIPASDSAAIYLNLMAGTGTAWFDDVQLVRVGE